MRKRHFPVQVLGYLRQNTGNEGEGRLRRRTGNRCPGEVTIRSRNEADETILEILIRVRKLLVTFNTTKYDSLVILQLVH